MKQLKEFITPKIKEALNIATKAHSKQVRRGSNTPYITHPVKVVELVKQYGGSEEQCIIALLHDTLEDTDLTFDDIKEVFGLNIAYKVKTLTNSKEERNTFEDKASYLVYKIIHMQPDILFIKLADRIANITGLSTGEVSLELGRVFLGCDINPRAIKVTKRRLNEKN